MEGWSLWKRAPSPVNSPPDTTDLSTRANVGLGPVTRDDRIDRLGPLGAKVVRALQRAAVDRSIRSIVQNLVTGLGKYFRVRVNALNGSRWRLTLA